MMGNVQVPAQVEVLEYKDAMSGFERFVKRSVDFIAAFCGIAVLLPVLLFIYVAISSSFLSV